MSESDREKLLKLREPREVTGTVTIESDWIPHAPPKRPMTEAEEKLIAVCMEMTGYWRDVQGSEAFLEARKVVHRERCKQRDIDNLIAAKEEYIRAQDRLIAAKTAVPKEIIDEEYAKRGWG